MKLFIAVDMEGTTGLERLEEIFRGLPGYDFFRQMMAGDANAVVQGAIAGGATEIVVSDSHGYMCNLHPDDLLPGVQLRRGQLKRQWCQSKGLDGSYDAVIMIGFHAKAGSSDAILSHTWIPGFRDVRIDGESVPEPSLNALLAGTMGVPVIMLSGDDCVVQEASPVLGDIPYASVKTSQGYFKGEHLPIDKSRALLRATAAEAVKSARKIAPVTRKSPVTIEVDLSTDSRADPTIGARFDDNVRFLDGPYYKGDLALSDFEHVLRNHPDVVSPRDGTIAITNANFADSYRKLHSILGEIYERDIENLVDVVADTAGYARPDLESIVGRDYPLNEIGPRRRG